MLRIMADARMRGDVVAVRAGRESGVVDVEEALLSLVVRLTLTQGRDPLANGLAEHAVGLICRMARAALDSFAREVSREQLQCAIFWAAQ